MIFYSQVAIITGLTVQMYLLFENCQIPLKFGLILFRLKYVFSLRHLECFLFSKGGNLHITTSHSVPCKTPMTYATVRTFFKQSWLRNCMYKVLGVKGVYQFVLRWKVIYVLVLKALNNCLQFKMRISRALYTSVWGIHSVQILNTEIPQFSSPLRFSW